MKGAKCLELADRGSGDALAGCLGTLAEHLLGFVAADTSTPLPARLLVLVGAKEELPMLTP